MASIEPLPKQESPAHKLTPGTLAHLEYLSQLETPRYFNGHAVRRFLRETETTRSLSLFIKQQRTYRPIYSANIDFDSRLLDLDEPQLPVFRGSVYRDPLHLDRCQLDIHGQPKPLETGDNNYTYDLSLPILYDFSYDPSRPIQAWYQYGQPEPGHPLATYSEVYNEIASAEYCENNPQILVRAISEAAGDMLTLMNYIYYGINPASATANEELSTVETSSGVSNKELTFFSLGGAALGIAAGYYASKAASAWRKKVG